MAPNLWYRPGCGKEDLAGVWRYRIEDYRIVCRIEDERVVVLVLQVGYRRDFYED